MKSFAQISGHLVTPVVRGLEKEEEKERRGKEERDLERERGERSGSLCSLHLDTLAPCWLVREMREKVKFDQRGPGAP